MKLVPRRYPPRYRPFRAISSSAAATNASTGAGPLVPAGPGPHRHGALLGLPVADDEHVGHLLQLRLANLVADLLLPLVELDAQPAASASRSRTVAA